MEPTLSLGETALVQTTSVEPAVGDIIVFHPPAGTGNGSGEGGTECGLPDYRRGYEACSQPNPGVSEAQFIRRIVAGPGDTLSIVDGYPIVNGEKQSEPYVKACTAQTEEVCNFPHPIKIPPGYWFVLGDNRGESNDSRFWGPVPTSSIIGIVKWCGARGDTCQGS